MVTGTLATLRGLGVDRVRVLVVWREVAPTPDAVAAPAGFDPSDPAAYGGGWAVFDRLDLAAAAAGLRLDFDLTGPAPTWATTAQPPGTLASARRDADGFVPSDAAFRAFSLAAGRRYSGSYRSALGGGRVLPRVSFWSVWNEPNQPGWLAPQQNPVTGASLAPALYRGLVDAFWSGLRASGHGPGTDTLLVGELAPNGCPTGQPCPGYDALGPGYRATAPLPFLQALYCVGPAGSGRLRGAAAETVGCPARGGRARFRAAHPGLFAVSGFSEHPYSFSLAPNVGYSLPGERGFAPLADLSRLEGALDGALAADGSRRRLPLFLTEYGYVTNPPNPRYQITPSEQAVYLDEAQYLAARDPRVRALGQFELEDSNPAVECGCRPGDPRYWQNFEEGLVFLGGRPKPALGAYRLPIFLPGLEGPTRVAPPGIAVEVWGMLRPAPDRTTQRASVQWAPAGSGVFRVLARTITRDPSGLVDVTVRLPGSGRVRLAWTPPGRGASPLFSRLVPVSVG